MCEYIMVYGPQIFVGSAIIFVSSMCLIKVKIGIHTLCRLNTSSGYPGGGGGGRFKKTM